ncbi:MAG: hypothetical protein O2971_02320 [Proteobacteria bacterium]|nr:hypothetical protein [Pseudomonadota bacterium]
MTRNAKIVVFVVFNLILTLSVIYVFITPYNRTPGVRLGGTETAAPSNWANVDVGMEMQIKPEGFPPFVVNIWYVGTPEGVVTATAPDSGYWGRRVRNNPNGWIRIEDAAYQMQANQIVNPDVRDRMLRSWADKYNLDQVPGMSFAELSNPQQPWEVFLWTAR